MIAMPNDADIRNHLQALSPASPAEHDRQVSARARAVLGEPARRARRWPLAAAAAVLVALPLGFAMLQSPSSTSLDTVRSAEAGVSPAPGSTLDAPPARLEWQAAPGARAYRVVLLDAQANPVWQSDETRNPFVVLPPEALEGQHGQISWRVNIDGAGRPPPLGPYDFHVR